MTTAGPPIVLIKSNVVWFALLFAIIQPRLDLSEHADNLCKCIARLCMRHAVILREL